MIPLDDRGLLLGDGLFETVLAVGGRFDQLDAHLNRMAAGCAALGLPGLDRGEARAAMGEVLAPLGAVRAAVRLTLTAGSGGRGLDRPENPRPRLIATAAPSPKPQGPVRLALVGVRRNDQSPAARLKTLAYLDNVLARAEALAAGAEEALMLNTRGEVACAAAANVFWWSGDVLFTPALDCGVLAGTARARVLARAANLGIETREVRAAPEDLASADGLFLTNSLIGLRPAIGLGGGAPPPALMARLGSGFA